MRDNEFPLSLVFFICNKKCPFDFHNELLNHLIEVKPSFLMDAGEFSRITGSTFTLCMQCNAEVLVLLARLINMQMKHISKCFAACWS